MSTPIKLCRDPKSCQFHRVELMLAFLGPPYETIGLDRANGGHKATACLKISPFGLVPAIDEGGYTLSDTNAILTYLAQTYDPEGGVDFAPYPNVRDWLARIEAQPNVVAGSPIPELA